jgi:hypothetical protein
VCANREARRPRTVCGVAHLRGRSGGGSPSAGPSPPAHSRQRFPPAAAWRLPAASGAAEAASRGTSWARSTACHPRRARSIPPLALLRRTGRTRRAPATGFNERTKTAAQRSLSAAHAHTHSDSDRAQPPTRRERAWVKRVARDHLR